MKCAILLLILVPLSARLAFAQPVHMVQGIVCQKSSGQRLANVAVWNKTDRTRAASNDIGVFKIRAKKGDTIEFNIADFQIKDTVISNGDVLIAYLDKITAPTLLNEVTINSTSLKQDILQTKKIYRSKGVFYTGTPHYYYLFLKPMTFIYENFKGEVIAARKFKKIAANDLEGQEIRLHFNAAVVKSAVPEIEDSELDDFLVKYWPTIKQVRLWSTYDMMQYIRHSYLLTISKLK